MPLDVRRLRVLRELAARGTVAATAEALAYTPSAVSQQLSALEREAGMALLERDGRRLALTEAGRALVARTEEVLAALERAEADLEATRSEVQGALRMAAFSSAARVLMPRVVATLRERHPQLELHVQDGEPRDSIPMVRLGELDLALAQHFPFEARPDEPGLAREHLFDDELFLALGPSHPDYEPRLEVLEDETWVAGHPDTSCHTVVISACRAAGYEPKVRGLSNDFGVVCELVAAGLGVALVPRIAHSLAPAGVRFVPLADPLHRRVHAVVRAGAELRPAVAALIGVLRETRPL